MKLKPSYGFTLVEMLVVTSLMVSFSVFFANVYFSRAEEVLAERYAAEMMTLSNAAVVYAQTHSGEWPDAGNTIDPPCTDFEDTLSGDSYIVDLDGYVGGCPDVADFDSVLTIEKEYDTKSIAEMVSYMLPSAEIDGLNDKKIKVYVLKPRGNLELEFTSQVANSTTGELIISRPVGCLTPKLFVIPENSACLSGLDGGASIGGYVLYQVDHAVNTTPPDFDSWKVYIQTKEGAGSYATKVRCGGSTIKFNAIAYCE